MNAQATLAPLAQRMVNELAKVLSGESFRENAAADFLAVMRLQFKLIDNDVVDGFLERIGFTVDSTKDDLRNLVDAYFTKYPLPAGLVAAIRQVGFEFGQEAGDMKKADALKNLVGERNISPVEGEAGNQNSLFSLMLQK